MMKKKPFPCTTPGRHCPVCGTARIHDLGPFMVSACCQAGIVIGPCGQPHPDAYGHAVAAYLKGVRAAAEPIKPPAPAKSSGASTRGSHAACDHPATSAARRACRASR